MKIYKKLVRDRIPEIIESNGKKCDVKTLDDKEYLESLNKKLGEELEEYYKSGEIEELADIAEIIYAITEYKGVNRDKFERIRLDKKEKRGGFEKRLFLKMVYEEGDLRIDFEQAWEEIKEIINKDNVIYTLARKKPNTVLGILETGLLVLTKDKPELVNKEWIEAAWDALMQNKRLTAEDIPFQGKYRSSFIMALLSKLSYVKNETGPITLRLKL